jgi:hypothetical protein
VALELFGLAKTTMSVQRNVVDRYIAQIVWTGQDNEECKTAKCTADHLLWMSHYVCCIWIDQDDDNANVASQNALCCVWINQDDDNTMDVASQNALCHVWIDQDDDNRVCT